jgi:regulator of sigma E protease
MTLISAIVLLGILIFVHELGHFLVAKLMGVRVEKFSLGFGPKLIGKKVGDTEYLISAFPLGGYVKMLGENVLDETEEEAEELSEEDKKRAYSHQPVRKRFLIILAGPVFNILFASLVFAFIFLGGVTVLYPDVGEVMKDTPAERAGLMKGDRIIEIEGVEIQEWFQMTGIIYESPEKELVFKIKRGNDIIEHTIAPERKTEKNIFGEDKEIGLIGIRPSGESFIREVGPVEAVKNAVLKTVEISVLTVVAIVKLIQRAIPADNLGGPIMIVQMAGKQAAEGAVSFFYFMAVISINLGIINLFPIPVLDGGHLVFLGIEAVRKRPLEDKAIILAQKVGILILITIMAFAFYNDIIRIITGKGMP